MKKVIALDIGGTNTRLALINERYEIEAKLIRPTVTGNLDAFLNSVISIIEDGVPSFDGVIAIAMGVPGRVRIDGYIEYFRFSVYTVRSRKTDHFLSAVSA